MRRSRACGLLLHPTSLPGRWGVGDLGPEAHRYVEWLAAAGVGWWQVLPLNPPGPGESPYSATSTFAGNPLLVSPDLLVGDGLLTPDDIASAPSFEDGPVAFERVVPAKEALLRRAWERFRSAPPEGLAPAFEAFRHRERDWLDDYAAFAAIAHLEGSPVWQRWPEALALHDEAALATWTGAHGDEVGYRAFRQFLFFRQWEALHGFARERGVRIFGDLPLFVASASAEVWAHRELFHLDRRGWPTVVSGVPPDYFSETGQLWGNPQYDWERLAATGYRWWVDRLRHALRFAELLRIDHFRGFAASWAVPAGDVTAAGGHWSPGPGRALFDAARGALGELPLVAEDLGTITPDVVELKDALGLPGMAVLQFAFDPAERSTFLPHNHVRNLVVYTGTHDNNTTVGWWRQEAGEVRRDFLRRYAGTEGHEVHWDLIRLALASVARLAVIPHQDVAGLDGTARMNTPGIAAGNWRFRLPRTALDEGLRDRLAALVELYDRRP